MAQYKVPQDVEADDKLIGPFSFRQFVYLLIAGGLVALAVMLFQLFPLLAIVPVPFILFFAALALPLKKDQPMETYLAAVISYYIKPHNRVWTPGQRETTIDIVAPKVVDDEDRSRDLTGEEATHRLSFLADIVDSGGRAIDGDGAGHVNQDLVAEANATNDMFETGHFERLEGAIAKDENERHATVMEEMRQAIQAADSIRMMDRATGEEAHVENFRSTIEKKPEKFENSEQPQAESSIIELANNDDFSVATIAKEAKRIKEKKEDEVYISLH